MEKEVKIKLEKEDVSSLEAKLGKPLFFEQRNIIYRACEGVARLRFEKGKTLLTYKGLNEGLGKINIRKELEFEVNESNEGKLQEFMTLLGLEKQLDYTKQRANYLAENCVLSLDALPNEEFYLEIEGEEDNIIRTVSILGFENRTFERRSYFEILYKPSFQFNDLNELQSG